jgi:PKD repeat protein
VACALATAGSAAGAVHPIGDGAWSWFGDPRAVTYTGTHTRTYVGWVDQEGDIKVSSYDHTTGERVTAVLHARLQQDDHANPSIQVRPDGHLVVYYSAHVGPAMYYRVSSAPEDVTAWGHSQTVDENTPGGFGYTYPNPIRLEDEDRTYLFWRGGNYNPTFSIQNDGQATWSSPARTLITNPGSRPYVKYDASGGDTIHVAYTNLHPGEQANIARDSNIYYARVRGGRIERVDGQQVGSLDDPIEPDEGDLVWDGAAPAWIHDVAADPSGNPVLVFASFPTVTDHRYHYARWTGSAWEVNEITPAGASIAEEPDRSPRYSGGITLDHEDPSRIYLSRQVGAGAWQVETRTTVDNGATWGPATVLSAGGKNVRPVSPRGMVAGEELSVIWMTGGYWNYEDYDTAIHTFMPIASNAPPVADSEPNVRSGPAGLEVTFGSGGSRDSDGSIAGYAWDFDGDGTTDATGPEPTHPYTVSGRYFPTLTVTDDDGASSVFVEEILVGLPVAPEVHTGGANGATVHGAVDPQSQATAWHVEYGATEEYGAATAAQTVSGASLQQVEATLPGLEQGRLYHYRLVAGNDTGSVSGDDRVFVAGSAPGSDAYRDAVLATAGLADYWRLGELAGTTSKDETSATTGTLGGRYVLGQPGVLGPLRNTAASFDGVGAELAIQGSGLGSDATVEGWFRWRSGRTVLRDNTGPSRGWMPALAGGTDQAFLTYRVGGPSINSGKPIGLVRDGDWHHIVVTKSGSSAALYVDGTQEHSTTGASGSGDAAASPWHVMRNGFNDTYSAGEADELALYTRALSAAEVSAHHDLAQNLADDPLPVNPPDPGTDPPAGEPPVAGSGPGGGAPGTTPGPNTPAPRTGMVLVRRGVLIARGAPGARNDITVRRRGRRWTVSDRLAGLRAGAACRRVNSRTVSCSARRVRRIVLYGGAGNDRLTVIGRIRVSFRGGPGRDIERRRLR